MSNSEYLCATFAVLRRSTLGRLFLQVVYIRSIPSLQIVQSESKRITECSSLMLEAPRVAQ